MKGCSRWLRIGNLPLDYQCRKTFEATRENFEGLESIATKTLNLTNCNEARIQVKPNLCGIIPTTTEITDFNRSNFFLNFDDIEPMDPPCIFKGSLILKDFQKPY